MTTTQRIHTAGVVSAVLLALVISSTNVGSVLAPSRAVASSAQATIAVTGLQLPAGVRYSVAVMKPLDQTLRAVQVQVGLPPDADLVEVLETPGRTELRDGPPGILIWSGAEFAPGEQIDAFSFALARAPEGEFRVNVFWAGDAPGQANYLGRPAVGGVGAFMGQAGIGSAGTSGTWIPVADTGVQVNVPSGAAPDGTVLAVQHMTPDDDPPGQAPDLWWCAGVDVRGLPQDASVSLLVPARRVLPPGTSVSLFAQRGGIWQRLAESGLATADGQFVSIATTGNGKVAAGISTALQAQVARGPLPGDLQVILPSGVPAPARPPVEQVPALPPTAPDEPAPDQELNLD